MNQNFESALRNTILFKNLRLIFYRSLFQKFKSFQTTSGSIYIQYYIINQRLPELPCTGGFRLTGPRTLIFASRIFRPQLCNFGQGGLLFIHIYVLPGFLAYKPPRTGYRFVSETRSTYLGFFSIKLLSRCNADTYRCV